MMMFYRKDLFENADEQAAFKAKYGYDLAVPTTWDAYRDAAEFFTRKSGVTLAGQPLTADFAGVAMTGKRHVATVLEWMNYGWTFGGGILDDSGQLVIDSQQSVAALDYMLGLRDFAQPGYHQCHLGRDDGHAPARECRPLDHMGRHGRRHGGGRSIRRRRQDGVCQHPDARER